MESTCEESALLQALIAIPSVNPSLVSDALGEHDIATFVGEWLEAAGVEVVFQTVAPGRPNVIGRVRGRGGGKTLMLNAHTDTVALGGDRGAITPVVEANRVYGRGAFDMKGSLAAIMLAARDYAECPGRGDLLVTAVVDEEFASTGTEAIAREFTADAAIVTEPTDLELSIAHKGFVWLQIETNGVAAHGSLPDAGVDAIARMGRVLMAIDAVNGHLMSSSGHPLLGTGSVHASLIEGGTGLSTYPDRCKLSIERRTIPGETDKIVMDEIQEILDSLSRNDPNFRASARMTFSRQPFEIDACHPFATMVRETITAVLGKRPAVVGETGWMDSAILSEAGIPTIIFGPAGDGAHAREEWVDIETVKLCRRIYLETAKDFCH